MIMKCISCLTAGTSFEQVKKVPLYMLDHETELNNLTSVYVPPVQERASLYQQFDVLREIIADLRGPNGCPWDKKQTHQSLKKYLIEEAMKYWKQLMKRMMIT